MIGDSFVHIQTRCPAECGGHIGTVSGRYYAMDRDQRWDRVELAWNNIVYADGIAADSAQAAIQHSYDSGKNDEFVLPSHLPGLQLPQAGDEMIFFNFRNDRARQICAAFALADFDEFDRGEAYQPITVTCLTHYDSRLDSPVAFNAVRPQPTLGSVISDAGLQQLHCAETEKYAHVTFFFNGGREAPYPGEERKLLPSPRVATYDLQPQMSAEGIRDAVMTALDEDYAVLIVNFANGDMVGHTGKLAPAIKAIETVDAHVGEIVAKVLAKGGSAIVTADHGNAEQMWNPETNSPHTSHTTYDVECILVDERLDASTELRSGGRLADVIPTAFAMMGLDQPDEMTGQSLLI